MISIEKVRNGPRKKLLLPQMQEMVPLSWYLPTPGYAQRKERKLQDNLYPREYIFIRMGQVNVMGRAATERCEVPGCRAKRGCNGLPRPRL